MLVWLKNSEGKWDRSGEPLEKYVQIAIDQKAAGNGLYTLADGIAAVEKAISKPDNTHFRYELPGASVAALRRAGVATESTPATPAKEKAARKTERKKTAKKSGKPEVQEPARITTAQHTLDLEPMPQCKAFAAKVHGRNSMVVFQERNRSKADFRYNPVTIPESKFAGASRVAKQHSLPIYVGLQIRVNGKWDSGWLIPAVLFKQWRRNQDFLLTADARSAYAADKSSVLGVRFQEAK